MPFVGKRKAFSQHVDNSRVLTPACLILQGSILQCMHNELNTRQFGHGHESGFADGLKNKVSLKWQALENGKYQEYNGNLTNVEQPFVFFSKAIQGAS